ncbi:DUF3048 domain-containing protein [Tissierella sp.]|uniref:DUF3048 domain-containing protein n=1 Tax=Tissierella sp. TaxID=41274 RepID=UPI00285DEFFB|nr:DUF3048 domain-containing protein [Tissierella sp.]MDR7857124.1 DUF3048 domain-containing protein [Tissierella sp.]
MKLKSIIIIAILIAIIGTACKKDSVDEPVVVDKETEVEEEIVIEELPVKEGIPSPLSGIYSPEAKVNRRPIAIMFDNHHRARWQAGLKDAEIVYEFLVEAPYTRYMGIYLVNEPESIGPIRSARPYFITTALEYDGIYVHVGGSAQALSDVKSLKLADIDGLSSSNKVFWRKSHKKAPNNLYSSTEALRKTQEERKFKDTGDYIPFKFKEDESPIEGNIANKLTIIYRKNNTTEYNYDEEKKIYTRTKDGELHIDEIDSTPIIAKNIIIQEAKTKVLDKEGRLEIQLIGEGKGKYITHGKVTEIQWVKESRKAKTIYKTLDGEELILNPGITWIQVIEPKTEVIFE